MTEAGNPARRCRLTFKIFECEIQTLILFWWKVCVKLLLPCSGELLVKTWTLLIWRFYVWWCNRTLSIYTTFSNQALIKQHNHLQQSLNRLKPVLFPCGFVRIFKASLTIKLKLGQPISKEHYFNCSRIFQIQRNTVPNEKICFC